ncbi:acyltransferase [Companilactobacillus kimchii]|uniref:Acyltransferase 3 domain-containing protein n=2 Tax=Companilactobacillus kimchii TaxID=2801452 RepID=A0A210PB29_9LACO|nr:acyltransferase [Companilactobacillus kimchii]KAE9557861.1 hypothetical protein ATN91_03605 [Companilactobacillus kimchii]OWF33692.1 hypothetical protein LKACC12383_00832 [Companilactobacillus kimchii]GEO48267.1 hypothetical protein LKI01_22660 [Companilactobacillus paralimentarius]
MKNKRLIYVDTIRVFAMLLVVLAHSCADDLANYQPTLKWGVVNSIVIVTEIAVPLFFMISGAMVLNSKRTYDLKYLFKHRLVRVVVPFLLWSVVSAYLARAMSGPVDMKDFSNTLLMMYHKPVLVAYWFMYPLIALYLLSPFLKAIADKIDDKMLMYLLILWVIIDIALPTLTTTTPKNIGVYFNSFDLGRVVVSKDIGYFFIGYRISKIDKHSLKLNMNILIAAVLMAINILISFISLKPSLQFLNAIANINTPIIAALVFMLFKRFETSYGKGFARVIELIAPLTYGVYLVHGLSIQFVMKYYVNANFLYVFVLATVLSLLVILILSKIPVIKRLFT